MTGASGIQRMLQPGPRFIRFATAIVLLVLCGFLLVFFLAYLPARRRQVMAAWHARLSSIAHDRQAGIEEWVHGRLGDASVVAAYPSVIYLASGSTGPPFPFPAEAGATAHLAEIFGIVARAYEYRGVYLVDTKGRLLAASPGSIPLETGCVEAARRAVETGKSSIDFHAHAPSAPAVSTVAPVHASDPSGHDRIVGAVVLSSDPERWLYPWLRREPVPTDTAESILVRALGGDAQFLSPLRHRDDPPMTCLRALGRPDFAARAALAGIRGVGAYTDYRGVEVLAATTTINNTPWALVAKVDRVEALAPLAAESRLTAIAGAAFLLAGAASGLSLWRMRRAQYDAALATARARFAALLEHANDAILFVAPDGRVQEANRRAETMYGYPRNDLIGKSVLTDLRPPESQAEAPTQLATALAAGEARFETFHRRADGTSFPVEVNSRRVVVEGFDGVVSIIRDISERRAAEAALKASETRFRELFEDSINCIAVYEAVHGGDDFVIVAFNSAAEKAEATRRESVLGRRVTEVFPGVVEMGLLDVFRRVYRSGEPEHHPVSFYVDEHHSGWRENYVYKLASGEVVAIYEDLTERQRIEAAFQRERDFSAAVLKSLPGIAYCVNTSYKFLRWNANFESVSGYTGEEVARRSPLDYFAGDDKEVLAARIQEVFQRGSSAVEADFVTKDGARIPYYFTAVRAEIEGEQCLVGVGLDISERKQAEEERVRLLEQVRGLAVRVVEVEDGERTRLARELHDRVGQTLTALGLNLAMIRSTLGVGTAAVEGLLADSQALLTAASDQVRDVMADLRPPVLDDYGLVAALRWQVERLASRTGLQAAISGADLTPRPPISVEIALFRAVQEALTNVAKHARASQVTVSVDQRHGGVRIVVADDGIGFVVGAEPRREASRGWGLIGMRERVEAIGGTVAVTSAPGAGTQVIIEMRTGDEDQRLDR